MSAAELALPETVLRAIAAGRAEFAKTGYAIERFEIVVRTHAEAFELVFVPEQAPGQSVRGGRTDAGRELHYWLAANDFTLQRTSYAR
jgi:hypothetical protein